MGNMHMALPVYKRYAKENQEPTMFERIMKEGTCGYVYTGTYNGLVTGSAASGTAIACGTKTLMNMVGVDPNGNKLESALTVAKKLNYKTALVSNAGLTDATPAVFYAHTPDRDRENDIALELLTGRLADVVLGGGGSKFIPQGHTLSDFFPNEGKNDFQSGRQDTINLIKGFQQMGYNLCFNLNELHAVSEDKPLLGLFSGGGLPASIDRDSATSSIPTVNDMAGKALQIISANNNSYFTMIECARIDWEAHDNDIGAVYQAVEEMNRVLKTAYRFYQKDTGNTLLIFTADHETGGLEIAYRKMPVEQAQKKILDDGQVWTNITNPLSYDEYIKILDRQQKTVSYILTRSHTVEEIQKNFKEFMGVELSEKDAELIYYSRNDYKRYKNNND
jgi:alkaline phosphatase